MKILAINSSLRGDRGYTRLLVDKLLQGSREAGAEGEVVTLAVCANVEEETPLFHLLKRFRPVKKMVIKYARHMYEQGGNS